MRHKLHHALKIMDARDGGLRDEHHEIRTGDRCDDGAAGAGRSVAENQLMAQLSRQLGGAVAHLRHKPSRILLRNAKLRMHHGPMIRAGDIPTPRDVGCAGNCLHRTDPQTESATFAEKRLDPIRHADEVVGRTVEVNGVEMTCRRTFAATEAGIRINRTRRSPCEIVRFTNHRHQQQMQIGRVDVVVRKHLALRQTGQRSDDRRLARPPLAANHGDFLIAGRRSPHKRHRRSQLPRKVLIHRNGRQRCGQMIKDIEQFFA